MPSSSLPLNGISSLVVFLVSFHNNHINRLKSTKEMLFYLFLLILTVNLSTGRSDELFQKDIGNQMVIGPSDKGYRSVRLKCGSDSMLVELETDEDFDGVIYTRGSFYDRKSPCFLDGSTNTGKRNRRSFSMKLPLNQCRMKRDGAIYSNVLVLQHDKDLIMPGDAAFNLECDFNNSRDIVVKSKLQQSEKSVVSRITLTDADPSVKQFVRNKRNSLENHTDTVILTKEFLQQQRKDEL